MNAKPAIIVVLALIIIGAIFYFFVARPGSTPGIPNTAVDTRPLKTYYDPRYGIAFNFPDTYTVQEHDSITVPKHHTIVIGDKAALANPPQNSESPPTMAIDIYDNPTKETPQKWITTNAASNYKQSENAALATTTVAGIPAYAYAWDGLYRSASIVFPDNGKIYMLSVGYNSPDDQLYKDFAGIVAAIQFDQ